MKYCDLFLARNTRKQENLKDVLDFWIFTLVFAHSLRIGKYGRRFRDCNPF